MPVLQASLLPPSRCPPAIWDHTHRHIWPLCGMSQLPLTHMKACRSTLVMHTHVHGAVQTHVAHT